jgi:hypothetical protein
MSTRSTALALVLAASCSEGDDPRPASWELISAAIFQPSCATASCHSPGAAADGLSFADADSGYISLTGLWTWVEDPTGEREGCRDVGGVHLCRHLRQFINPYNPAQSRLVHLLRAQGAPRMPPDRPLPEVDIQLVERWILDGAPRRLETGGDGGDGGVSDASGDAPEDGGP